MIGKMGCFILILIISLPLYSAQKIILDAHFEGKIKKITNYPIYNGFAIGGLDWLDNKQIIYACGGDILKYDLENQKIETLHKYGFKISYLSVSPNRKVASLSFGNVFVLDLISKKEEVIWGDDWRKNTFYYEPNEIKWLPNEKGLIFIFELTSQEGLEGYGIAIYDIKTRQIKEIPGITLFSGYSIGLNYQNAIFYIIGKDFEGKNVSDQLLLLDPKTNALKGKIEIIDLPYLRVESIDNKGENVLITSQPPTIKEYKKKYEYESILWMYNIKESTLFFVTRDEGYNFPPLMARFSPDGKKIVFIKNSNLYLLPLEK